MRLARNVLYLWRRIIFRSQRAQLARELAEELAFHRALREEENR
jgi:hypothetical protein